MSQSEAFPKFQLIVTPDEQIEAANREMTKRAIRNIVIFVGIKVAIAYSMHRWAKYIAENN